MRSASVLLLVLLTQPPLDQERGPAKLAIRTPSGKNELRLSDLVTVDIEISATAVTSPKDITHSPGWRVWSSTPLAKRMVGKETLWRQSFSLAPLGPGDLALQIEPWQVDGAAIEWQVLPLKVTTFPDEPDLAKSRDITPPEGVPPPAPAVFWWPWLIAGGLILFAAGWLLGNSRRRSAPTRTASPRERALAQVARLVARRLPEKNRTSRFASLLTVIVRAYLEKTLQLPARARTTGELAPLLSADQRLADEDRAAIRSVLDRCDRIRFAGEIVSSVECNELAAATARLIATIPSAAPGANSGSATPSL
ncbi:MAG: hypothetical protein U0793_03625 [Gemmataceae bacterium]